MTLSKVIKTIHSHHKMIVTSHANPDGDALGSMLALAAGLKKLGKDVTLYTSAGIPDNLMYLPGAKEVSGKLSAKDRYDVGFIVDCAEKERVGETFAKSKGIGTLVVVDHHKLSGRCGDINLIDPSAASTGVVVHRLLKKLKVPITRDIAMAIYTTLVTDTGSFAYSNTKASVHTLAASLLKTGVEPSVVSQSLFENYPASRYKILGAVLQTLEVGVQGKFASIFITQAMLKKAKASADVTEGFVIYPRSIAGVIVAAQFRETREGDIKVSLRSKHTVDVAAICSKFGGGGHPRAAGCTFKKGSIALAKKKIYAAVKSDFESHFETLEIENDRKMMRSIRRSQAYFNKHKGKEIKWD